MILVFNLFQVENKNNIIELLNDIATAVYENPILPENSCKQISLKLILQKIFQECR